MEPAGEVLAAPGVVVEGLDLAVQLVDAPGRLGPGPGQQLRRRPPSRADARRPAGPRPPAASRSRPPAGPGARPGHRRTAGAAGPGPATRPPGPSAATGSPPTPGPPGPGPRRVAAGAGGGRRGSSARRPAPRPVGPDGLGSSALRDRVGVRARRSAAGLRAVRPGGIRPGRGRAADGSAAASARPQPFQARDRRRDQPLVLRLPGGRPGPRGAGRSWPRRSTALSRTSTCGGPDRELAPLGGDEVVLQRVGDPDGGVEADDPRGPLERVRGPHQRLERRGRGRRRAFERQQALGQERRPGPPPRSGTGPSGRSR